MRLRLRNGLDWWVHNGVFHCVIAVPKGSRLEHETMPEDSPAAFFASFRAKNADVIIGTKLVDLTVRQWLVLRARRAAGYWRMKLGAFWIWCKEG